MRKPFLSIAILLCLYAQTALSAQNALLFNLGPSVFGYYELAYERKLSQNFSLSTLASYYDTRAVLVRVYSLAYQASLGSAGKVHLWGDPLKNSIYISPYVKLGYLVHVKTEHKEEDHNISARTGAAFGWTKVFDSGLALDINWSLENFQFFNLDKDPQKKHASQDTMFRPFFVIALGYAW